MIRTVGEWLSLYWATYLSADILYSTCPWLASCGVHTGSPVILYVSLLFEEVKLFRLAMSENFTENWTETTRLIWYIINARCSSWWRNGEQVKRWINGLLKACRIRFKFFPKISFDNLFKKSQWTWAETLLHPGILITLRGRRTLFRRRPKSLTELACHWVQLSHWLWCISCRRKAASRFSDHRRLQMFCEPALSLPPILISAISIQAPAATASIPEMEAGENWTAPVNQITSTPRLQDTPTVKRDRWNGISRAENP